MPQGNLLGHQLKFPLGNGTAAAECVLIWGRKYFRQSSMEVYLFSGLLSQGPLRLKLCYS